MPKQLAALYRAWAEECRQKAEATSDVVGKARWLVMADEWLRLAEQTFPLQKN